MVSLDLTTPVDGPLTVSIRKARTVSVTVDGTTVSGMTAAETVGGALLALDIPLQDLDYSIPAETADLPEDGQIELVRVHEEIQIATDEVAYANTYVEDPTTPLDETSVVEPGQMGFTLLVCAFVTPMVKKSGGTVTTPGRPARPKTASWAMAPIS